MTWLDNSRIFAIFAVIFVHVSVGVPWQSEMGSLLWVYGSSIDVLVRWCVPVFVMVSGALLLGPHEKESLSDFYLKRMSKVLIPLVFWSLFYIVWGYFRENVQEEFTFSYVIGKLASGKPYYHLWFMYMLLGLYAFTPVFRVIVANLSTKALVFFIAMAFAIDAVQSVYEAWYVGESNLFLTWFLTYTPYYLTGYLVRYHQPPLSTRTLGLMTLGSAILAATAFCLVSLYVEGGGNGYFFKNLSLTNIFVSLSLMFFLRRMERPVLGPKLTGAMSQITFGIYLLHMVPLAYLHDLKEFWGLFSPYLYIPVFSLTVLIVTAILVQGIKQIPYLRRVI